MRPALELIFATVDVDRARTAVQIDAQREALRIELNQAIDEIVQIPASQYADNLLQGLLALRMKFDREEAMQKLELNLAMRSQRRP
jgi:hypothetical protein